MNFDKVRKYSHLVTLIIGASIIAYLFFSRVLIYILPFLIGWTIAFAMRPASVYLEGRLKIGRKYLRLILTLVLFVVLFGVLAVAVWLLSREVWDLLSGLEEGTLEELLSPLVRSGGFFGRLFGELGDYVADAAYRLITSVLTSFGSAVGALVSGVPKALFFILVSVISSVYFALYLEDVNSAVKSFLPQNVFESLTDLKDGFLGAFLKYMRSYLLLLLITFFEMLVGLFIIRAPYPLLMAIVIAALDLLPIIGVGFVLIPWGVWSFAVGKVPFGIAVLVLFVIHTVLREIIEPRIVGRNLGTHPLLTLIFIYLGYSLFGIMGLLLVPILTVLVNTALGKKDSSKVSQWGE